MKSIFLLTALLMACAACTGERAGQPAAATPRSTGEPAAPRAGSDPGVAPEQTVQATATDPAPSAPPSSPQAPVATRTTPAGASAPPTKPEARRISPDELRAMIDRGDAVLVDVRGASDWAYRHASEAIHIPSQDLFARSVELPHEKLIAFYCT